MFSAPIVWFKFRFTIITYLPLTWMSCWCINSTSTWKFTFVSEWIGVNLRTTPTSYTHVFVYSIRCFTPLIHMSYELYAKRTCVCVCVCHFMFKITSLSIKWNLFQNTNIDKVVRKFSFIQCQADSSLEKVNTCIMHFFLLLACKCFWMETNKPKKINSC